MNNNNKTTVNGGIGFTGMLQIAFIVLKLLGVITWSWWLVLTPIWVSILLLAIVLIVIVWLIH